MQKKTKYIIIGLSSIIILLLILIYLHRSASTVPFVIDEVEMPYQGYDLGKENDPYYAKEFNGPTGAPTPGNESAAQQMKESTRSEAINKFANSSGFSKAEVASIIDGLAKWDSDISKTAGMYVDSIVMVSDVKASIYVSGYSSSSPYVIEANKVNNKWIFTSSGVDKR